MATQTFTFEESGFAVDAPNTWHAWPPSPWVRNTIRLTGPGLGVEIRLPADPTGRMWFILPSGIGRAIPIASVDDLIGHVVDEYRAQSAMQTSQVRVEQTPILLGDSTATLLKVGPHANIRLGPAEATYVVAVRAGQPIVLRSIGIREKADEFRRIVESFRFLDSVPSAEAPRAHTFEEAGFAINLPDGWLPQPSATDYETRIRGPDTVLTVRIGRPDGRIWSCYMPAACTLLAASSLDDLVRLAAVENCDGAQFINQQKCGDWMLEHLRQQPFSLGDTAATRLSYWPRQTSAWEDEANVIVGFLDARPIMLRWRGPLGAELREILNSIVVLD